MWFDISEELSNDALASRLGHGLSVDNGGGKELKLIWSRGRAVACRISGNLLKVFLSEPELIASAKRQWKVAGES